MVTEIGILLFIWISIGVDCSKIHKEVIDFLQFEADGLIHALVSLSENLVRKLSFHYLG